jgi:hypothetical protein
MKIGVKVIKRIQFITIPIIFLIIIIGNTLCTYASEYFDITDINKGLIHVTYNDGGKIKLIIEKEGEKYTYDVNSSGLKESFPLQLGNGDYKISLYKNTTGANYKFLQSKSINVQINNLNDVYLNSIQNINWNVDSKAVLKAVELTKEEKDLEKKAETLWNFMVKNNSYDFAKLSTLTSGYIPVIDKTLEEKKGICYDFTSLYGAMLRSQGIPAKLVKGYAPKNAAGYHSWNEVYDVTKKAWVVIDTTYDIQVLTRKNIPMLKNIDDYDKIYEY